jgi:hypothetical protein
MMKRIVRNSLWDFKSDINESDEREEGELDDYCEEEESYKSDGIRYSVIGDIIIIINVKMKNGIEYPATMYRTVPNAGPSIRPIHFYYIYYHNYYYYYYYFSYHYYIYYYFYLIQLSFPFRRSFFPLMMDRRFKGRCTPHTHMRYSLFLIRIYLSKIR